MFFRKIFLYASFSLLIFSVPAFADAATFRFSPASGSHNTNTTFTVSVLVDSGGQGINSVEGTINFNQNILSVVSLSQAGSIFNLWAIEPSFSNTQGTITFGGGKTPPAYIGTAGNVFSITFRAQNTGTAQVSFASGAQILAADGMGTNVFQNSSGGSYTVAQAPAPAPTPPPAPAPAPTPKPTPTPSPSPATVEKSEPAITDLTAEFDQRRGLIINISAEDELSAIDRFEIDVALLEAEEGDSETFEFLAVSVSVGDGDYIITMPFLAPGEYSITAKAFNEDGDYAEKTLEEVVVGTVTSSEAEKDETCSDGGVPGWAWFLILILAVFNGVVAYRYYTIKKLLEKEEQGVLKEVVDAQKKMKNIYDALREEVEEQIRSLNKRRKTLTDQEKEAIEELREALDISEELMKREIEDIEKEIKK